MKSINIPTINDTQQDFDHLFRIWQDSIGYDQQVQFEFANCHFLRPNAIAFIGGLARLIESRRGTVTFDWDTLGSQWLKSTLMQNGFAGAFGYPSTGWTGETIPYREDDTENATGFLDYLTCHWLGRGWVHVSDMLRDAIVGKVWEIYANAFEHSQSPIGMFSCGTHFKKNNTLVLSVADFGLGIANNVRNFLSADSRATDLTSAGCMRWAFKEGTTTRPNGVKRGMGLELLKAFIKINHGKLEVYSNNGYALIDESGERYMDRVASFEGTLIHITLRCDEKFYRFASETDTNWPF